MGLLDRVNAARTETRAVQMPWQPWTSPYIPFSAGGPIHPSEFRQSVEAALSLSPLYAGARLLADMVASLPLQQYRKPPGGKPVRLNNSSLFDHPASYGTVYDWLHQCMVSLVLQGNAWGLITSRDGYGYPLTIEWVPPERVEVVDDEQQPWNPARALIYFFGAQIPREDLFHVRAFTVPGKIAGMSPLRLFMNLISSGNDALEYGASWYRSGGWPPGTFQNQELEVDSEQADEIRRRLTRSIQRREPLVYGRDWDYKPVAVPPNEAQFIQAMQLNATQIAAILGLPPERIGGSRGDSLTYSTQEQESISLVVDTLRPWLVRLETAFFDVLPAQQYVRFNSDAMLKVTTEQRHAIYKLDRDIGLKTIDELRELEEMGPLPKLGSDPISHEVMVAMARGIKEIPKSLVPLVQESPADQLQREQALVLAQEAAANPQAPPPPVYPEQGGSAAGQNGSQGGNGGGGNGSRGGQDGKQPAAADGNSARWLSDYQLGPAEIRKIMNGASHG
jgi:HK97 family phage portal protein